MFVNKYALVSVVLDSVIFVYLFNFWLSSAQLSEIVRFTLQMQSSSDPCTMLSWKKQKTSELTTQTTWPHSSEQQLKAAVISPIVTVRTSHHLNRKSVISYISIVIFHSTLETQKQILCFNCGTRPRLMNWEQSSCGQILLLIKNIYTVWITINQWMLCYWQKKMQPGRIVMVSSAVTG